jgi:hypothetical protein
VHISACVATKWVKGVLVSEFKFLRCIGALIIDAIVAVIVFISYFKLFDQWRDGLFLITNQGYSDASISFVSLILTSAGLLVDVCLFVFIPQRLGGTIGQVCVGLRLTMLDKTTLRSNALTLRHAVSCLLLMGFIFQSWCDVMGASTSLVSTIIDYVPWIACAYLIINVFVMACNDAARSLSDLLANTCLYDKAELIQETQYEYVEVVEDEKQLTNIQSNNT